MALEDYRKRKTPDIEEDGEIVDDETPLKIAKVDNDNGNLSNLESEVITTDKCNLNKNLTNSSEQRSEIDGTTSSIQSVEVANNSPCITITFRNDSISNLYKMKFLKFINNFIELEAKSNNNHIEIYQDSTFNPEEWAVVDETLQESQLEEPKQTPSKKRKKEPKAKKELFIVDSNPSSNQSNSELRYISKFTISSEKTEDEAPPYKNPSKMMCFNCDQFHALKDCPEPKDYNKINAGRQRMRSQGGQKSLRYHLEEEQKYSHLVPGKLSSELRNALGLHKSQVPHFVYKMRKLGYPPGWLEDAKIVCSELELFDIDGKNLNNVGIKKSGLDPEKVIDYPGFNVAPEKGIRDEYKSFGVPPYSDIFSKDAMIKFFNQKYTTIEDDLEARDMDLDSSDELKRTTSNKKEKKEKSIHELEKEKQKLLEELQKEEKTDVKPTKNDIKKNDETSNISDKNKKAEEEDEEQQERGGYEKTPGEVSVVKTTCYGTPIIKSSSPFVKLPHADNFTKDVSPVINFENLPNSTGKYEQMTDVLQKVRKTLKNLQNCST